MTLQELNVTPKTKAIAFMSDNNCENLTLATSGKEGMEAFLEKFLGELEKEQVKNIKES